MDLPRYLCSFSNTSRVSSSVRGRMTALKNFAAPYVELGNGPSRRMRSEPQGWKVSTSAQSAQAQTLNIIHAF